jgi:hypothetical protein
MEDNMTCIVSKNRITCYDTPLNAEGFILAGDGNEYWCDLKKEIYDVLKEDAVILCYINHDVCGHLGRTDKKFIKRFTKWAGTVEEYLKRLEEETDKKCEVAKEALKLTNNNIIQ